MTSQQVEEPTTGASQTSQDAEGSRPEVVAGPSTDNGSAGESSSSSPAKKCAQCGKTESDPEQPLKPCSKCQSVHYCSRDCTKANWKQHKKNCPQLAQIYAQNADLKPSAPPRLPKKEGHRGGLQKWQFDT